MTVDRDGSSFRGCFDFDVGPGSWNQQQLVIDVEAGDVTLYAYRVDGGGQWTMNLSGPIEGPLTGTIVHDYWYGTLWGTIETDVELVKVMQ